MRSIWNGSITFGLITIPVKLYSAVGGSSVDLHMLHDDDAAPIHYKRVCEKGHEVDWGDVVKGYEYEPGKWVKISQDELQALDADSIKSIDIQTFCPMEDIDPLYFDRTYFVAPDEPGLKAYRLLAEAMEAEQLVGIAKVAIREREHLAAVRLMEDMLVLETMHWPADVRVAEFDVLDKRVRLRDSEVKMARQLIQQLVGPFEPDEFEDEYQAALEELIRRKIEGEEIEIAEPEEEPAEVIDLMDALRASVEEARTGKKRKEPAASKRSRSRKVPSKKDLRGLSKKELYERARELDIEGRSDMGKDELIEAIGAR